MKHSQIWIHCNGNVSSVSIAAALWILELLTHSAFTSLYTHTDMNYRLSWHLHRRLRGRIPMGERSHEENPRLHWHQHRRHYGQNSYGRNAHMKRNHCCTDINTEVPWAKITMGETLAQEEKPPGYHDIYTEDSAAEFLWATAHMKKIHGSIDINTEDTMGRIPMGEMLTWRKSLTLMTLTQKTPWAEFLWAKRSLEENPLLYWHQHGRLHGRNSYGRTLTWRKTTAPPMLTQKTLWAEFLWAKRLFKTLWDI